MANSRRELTYILTQERGVPSFDPVHSDTLLNAYFIEQMVGTLVKNGFDGTPKGCLAESWQASDDRLKFSFKMRPGMTCTDGTPIDAEGFRRNLERLFKLYIGTNKNLPVFEHLHGFKDFREGHSKNIAGIDVNNEQISFSFSTVPDGLLAFLSMPYYGFYCDANFDGAGKWLDPHKLIASGQWQLEEFAPSLVKMARRKDWFNLAEKAPDFVTVKMMTVEEAGRQEPAATIIQKRIENANDIQPGFRKFLSTPTDLKAVVLSPVREGPFKNSTIRKAFRDQIQHQAIAARIQTENAVNSISFYSGRPPPKKTDEMVPMPLLKRWHGHVLKVVLSNALSANQLDYVKQILSKGATNLGLSIEFENEDRTLPGWKERLDALQDMDIRVVRVSVGGSYEPWVVRMMFCSRMGVSFPDPSGRLSDLTLSLTDRSSATAEKFESIVSEDAAVIPLFHTSFSWLVSDDLGINHLSPTSDLIRFELVEMP